MITLSWIAMIVCGISAAYPTEPSWISTLGTSLCVVAVAANAFMLGQYYG